MDSYKFCVLILIVQSVRGEIPKSSLTFVIDDTGSMFDDIEQVKYGVNLVFDTVLNSSASQIENFVIVTFNDPGTRFRTVTKDRNVFKQTLENISVDGGGDCPELAMEGIELALTKSLPGSYLYVLTDASAKDNYLLEKVQNLAMKKLSQIVFLLTGTCSYDDSDPQYQVYHQLADATNGQVFHMTKHNVGEILHYVAETISSRKTVVTSTKFSPGYDHNMTIPVDADMKDVVVAGSGISPKIDITAPDGSIPHAERIVDIPRVVAVKIKDTMPGNYTAKVGSESETSVVVTASTSIHFKHGFTVFEPSTIGATSIKPLPDENSHLAIQLITTSDDAVLNKVILTDLEDTNITEMPLKLVDAKQKLYTTELFTPPNKVFKITVKGYDNKSKSPFTRTGSTPVEPQKSFLEKYEDKAPTIKIEGGRNILAEYNEPLKLSCIVSGFPKPDALWFDSDGHILESVYSTLDIPYDYINVFMIDKVKQNVTYTCKASNRYGEASETVDVRTIKKNIFEIIKAPTERPKIDKTDIETTARKGEAAEIRCSIVKGEPTPQMVWYHFSGTSQTFVELNESSEVLHFTKVNEENAGFYRCLAENDAGRDHHMTELIVEYPPIISDDKTYVRSREGAETTLKCRTQGLPKPRVDWFLNNVRIFSDRKHHIYRDNSLRFTGSNDNVGLFSCVASNILGSANRTIRVDYFVPVTIDPPIESTIEVKEGTSLELPCKANGYPEPTLKWVFFSTIDNKIPPRKMSPSDTSGRLNLKSLRSPQDGYYTCVASNIESSSNITYRVVITAPPRIQRRSVTTFTGVNGDLVLRIPCKATGNPKPDITWSKGGLSVPSDSEWYDVEKDGTLVIKNLDNKSAGSYLCHAQNFLGNDMQTFYVIVNDSPVEATPTKTITLEEGMSGEVECDIPHTMLDTIRWYKDRRPIGTNDFLRLENVQISDSGIYMCRISNFANTSSGSTMVVVGYKPRFIDEVETFINFNEGMPAYLNCYAKGEPQPQVNWFNEEESINHKGFAYDLLMRFDDRGKYTCVVSNSFGSVNRTFEISSKDCILNLEDNFLINQPLLVDDDTLKWPQFENRNGNLVIPSGKSFLLYCPRGFTNFPTSKITAVCDRETDFLVDGYIFNYENLNCQEEVLPEIRKTGRKCTSANTEQIKIGYDVLGEFLEVFEVCFDKHNNIPVFAKQEMHKSLADVELKEPVWQDDLLPLEFDELYVCNNQINTISSVIQKWFHADDRCCFDKRQLVNTRDLLGGLPQKAALNYLNIIPHWSTCDSKNWNELENRVRKLAKSSLDNLLVWTGTYGQLTLNSSVGSIEKIALRDTSGQELPVPQYVWKVIQSPATKSSLAVVQLNIPDVSITEAYKHMLCRDVCPDIEWMRGVNWRDYIKGYTYCCSLPDFERAFGYKGHFGAGNSNILKDISSLSAFYFI